MSLVTKHALQVLYLNLAQPEPLHSRLFLQSLVYHLLYHLFCQSILCHLQIACAMAPPLEYVGSDYPSPRQIEMVEHLPNVLVIIL